MATAQTIVNRALRLCKVIDANGVAEASEAEDALATLNEMLAEWHVAEIGLPDYTMALLTTEFAGDAADMAAIAYALAVRVAPEYGAPLAEETLALSEITMGRLRLRYFQPGTSSSPDLPGAQSTFNITTGDA